MFLVLVLLTGAGGAYWVMDQISNVDRIDDLAVDQVAAGEPSNYLVVGSDVRPDSGEFGDVAGGRSDTIMIVRVDPETQEAWALSLPRDVIVPIAGTGEADKLNSAYAISHQTLVDTIRENFGIEVNHYVVVDFEGFRRVVDAVGGIEMYFDRGVKDDESGLFVNQLGCVTLDGGQALAYARSRHIRYAEADGTWSGQDPRADLGRIERQQMFIRAALEKVLEQIDNPVRATELITIGRDSVSLDPATDPLELLDQFSSFSLDNLVTYSLPVIDIVPEVSIQMDPVNAPAVLNIFRGADPNDVPAETITVDVLNGTGVEMQANDVAAAFQAVGFRLGDRSDYQPQPVANTTVYHRPGEEIQGLRVARHITGGAVIQAQADVESGHVTVVTGQDFTTIHMQPTPVDQMPPQPGAPATTTTAPTNTTTTTAPQQTTQTTQPSEFNIGTPC